MNLGYCYFHGYGVPKHAEHARTLFVMAYEQAHPGAEKLVEQLDKEVAEASAKQQEEPADEPESIGKLSRQSSDTQLRDFIPPAVEFIPSAHFLLWRDQSEGGPG